MTMTIFTGFLRVPDASKGRNILLFMDNRAIHCKVHHLYKS
jgi:hypothetical protein